MKLDVINPGSGHPVWSVEATDPAEVAAIVEKGREAGVWWSALGFDGRKGRLIGWAKTIASNIEELATIIHQEMGKPYDDARVEVVGAIGVIMWSVSNAERVLADRQVQSPPGFETLKGIVRYRPYGVVGVIGPWNFPVMTPVGVFGFALAAGNAVVLKPSEFAPRCGEWLRDAFAKVVPEQPVLQVVIGGGDVGGALVAARPDKVAFTGSVDTGRKVYEQCASMMIPVLLELGGKNAMIVAEDADIDLAVRSATFGAFQNSGQACIGLSRIIVLDKVYDEFVQKLRGQASRLEASPTGTMGPVVTERQINMLRDHVADATRNGARILIDGQPKEGSRYASPTILEGVTPKARIWREETFAPALIVIRASSIEEAVEIANGTEYGLGGSVFSKARGEEIADQLRSGMTAINSAMGFTYMPGMPFGGVGHSGIGRKHGDEGLREFARSHAIAIAESGNAHEGFGRPSHAVDGIVAGVRQALGIQK